MLVETRRGHLVRLQWLPEYSYTKFGALKYLVFVELL